MKSGMTSHYLTATTAIGTTLTLSHELGNPDMVSLSFVFLSSSIQFPIWELFFLTFVFYTGVILVNIMSYNLLFRLSRDSKILSISHFILLLVTKYTIPFFTIITITVNNRTLLHDMPITVCILRILVWFSLVLDWLIFYFRYDRKDAFTVKIFKWSFHIPSDNVYKTLAILVWGIVTIPVASKIIKKLIRTETNVKK
jgi:hypothetical protein